MDRAYTHISTMFTDLIGTYIPVQSKIRLLALRLEYNIDDRAKGVKIRKKRVHHRGKDQGIQS